MWGLKMLIVRLYNASLDGSLKQWVTSYYYENYNHYFDNEVKNTERLWKLGIQKVNTLQWLSPAKPSVNEKVHGLHLRMQS